jgi:N-acetylglucosaminyldiphosphoundecaprenol N-acetyl-beta-D-mannosaminyltransferase
VRVNGVRIFDGDLDDAVAVLRDRLARGSGARIATANLDFLAQASRDATLAADLEASTMVVPDGAPVVWLARRAGAGRVGRVAGVDLVARLCEDSGGRQRRVLLYGSTEEVARDAAARLHASDGTARVTGVICPPFRPLDAGEEEVERTAIVAARPDIVLVALGCPRQERLIARYFDCAPEAIWIGVGGTFELLSGRKRRAPAFMQAAGLEWVARLSQEPSRLWRRYLLRDAPFFLRLAPAYLLGRRRPASSLPSR